MVYTANQNIINTFDYHGWFYTSNSYQHTYQCI